MLGLVRSQGSIPATSPRRPLEVVSLEKEILERWSRMRSRLRPLPSVRDNNGAMAERHFRSFRLQTFANRPFSQLSESATQKDSQK
jgi:hypothetical protein